MSRTSIPVDKDILISVINHCESTQSFKNRGELFKIVAKTYCDGSDNKKVTPAIVYMRVKEWGLTVKTPVGKKGRLGGNPIGNVGTVRISREVKFAGSKSKSASIQAIAKIVPERFLPIVKKLKKGSLTAAVRLKCLDCCGYQVPEVKGCECTECSLWVFRPYQGK